MNVCILVSSNLPSLATNGWDVAAFVPGAPLRRLVFEYFTFPRIVKNRSVGGVYTFFGPGLPKIPGVKSVVNVAYPIICYPESKYWRYLPLRDKVGKKLLNAARVARIKQADVVICETEVMARRLQEVCGVTSKVVVLPPAPTEFLNEITCEDRLKEWGVNFRILVLGGLAHHKNNWRLWGVAKILRNNNVGVKFICSFSEKAFKRSVAAEDCEDTDWLVRNFFEFHGTVAPDQIDTIYRGCQMLINLSDLESFSNNYMEAWKAAVVLLCSDRDFSRSICGTSALYFEPHDPVGTAATITEAISLSLTSVSDMLNEGKKRLAKLPSENQRAAKIFELLSDD